MVDEPKRRSDTEYEQERVNYLAQKWQTGATNRQHAHARTAHRLQFTHYAIGIPAAVLGAVAGTSTLLSLANQMNVSPVVGVLTLAASALTAAQTFVGVQPRAQTHLAASAKYASIRRELEHLVVRIGSLNAAQLVERIETIRIRIDEAYATAPSVYIRPKDDFGFSSVKPVLSVPPAADGARPNQGFEP